MNPILARFLRASVAVILAGLAAHYQDNALWLAIAPVLMAIGKWLRDKYGWDFFPV